MRRKRLQHAADILCYMFCGWRLNTSKPVLAQLGSGLLEIDALSGDCSFNGRSVPPLTISVELRAWLKDDLAQHQIPIDAISRANLKANLSFTEIPWSERSTLEIFFANERAVQTATMHRCVINCASEIVTDEKTYRSTYADVEEWPPGWPAT